MARPNRSISLLWSMNNLPNNFPVQFKAACCTLTLLRRYFPKQWLCLDLPAKDVSLLCNTHSDTLQNLNVGVNTVSGQEYNQCPNEDRLNQDIQYNITKYVSVTQNENSLSLFVWSVGSLHTQYERLNRVNDSEV